MVTLTRLLDQPDRYRAGVISGAPLVPIPELLDADSTFDLDPLWLSEDPFYLDAMVNDPLAFVDADGAPLARALDTAWDRFGKDLPTLKVPTLAVHGVADPIAPDRRGEGICRADRTVARFASFPAGATTSSTTPCIAPWLSAIVEFLG